MIDYKKLGRLFNSSEAERLDLLINVDYTGLISEYNQKFIKGGFLEIKDNKHLLKMKDGEKSVFHITKSIAFENIDFLVKVIAKLLSDDFDLKEIDLLKEQMQTNQLEHDKISKAHQELNGELREDNKKLSKQVGDFLNKKVNGMRKKGL